MPSFLTAFLGSLANKQKFLDAQTGAYPNMQRLGDAAGGTTVN